jgi:hypothetical protein
MGCIVNDLGHIGFPLSNILSDIRHGVVISNRVADTNAKAVVEKPKVDDHLQASKELSSCLRTLFTEDDVD